MITWYLFMPMLIKRNCANANMTSGTLVDVPGIKGDISSDMGWVELQSDHGALIKAAIVTHIHSR